jgi:hypothetical protein
MAHSQQQLDAILEAQEQRPKEFGNLSAESVAKELAREGHPAWGGELPAGFAPFDAGPRVELAPEGAQLPAETGDEGTTALGHQQAAADNGLDMGAEDFELPILKIMQSQTSVEGDYPVPPGDLFVSIDPEGHAKERRLVILKNGRGRSFWLPRNDDAAAMTRERVFRDSGVDLPDDPKGPICASSDRIHPDPSDHGTLSTQCKGCKYSRWRDVGGKRKLDCGETYTFLCADVTDPDDPQPVIFRASKTSYKPAKKLLNALSLAARRHKVGLKPRHVAGLVVTMATVEDNNAKGDKFYVPKFDRPEKVEDHGIELDDMLAMLEACGGAIGKAGHVEGEE